METRTNAEGIMVTVVCITYNHENYIAEALDSFVRQKTNFKFKVFVGEDCGPDRTAEIVRQYAEKYPDIIVPFIREKNMGAQRNLIDLCQRAESPYIAFCEGDDYWIDDEKLQKQFDYMKANPELRACYGRARILAPDDWFLRSYFKANKDGELIFPDCEPAYKLKLEPISCDDCIWVFPAFTGTVFYRWTYDLDIPDWYYKGIIGDHPIFLMQLGEGEAGFLPDVLAVYRRSNVGIYMSDSMDEHFMKTRLDHVRWMQGMLEWYAEHQQHYPKEQLENRIKLEISNYLTTAIKLDNYEAILKLTHTYPEAVKIALNAYISFFRDSRLLAGTCTWEGYKLLVRNRYYRNGLRPYVWLIKVVDKTKVWLRRKLKNLLSFISYWAYSFVPKKKNLWVATSFRGHGYIDNSMYLYEFIVKNHPEIDIFWLTRDDDVYEKLKVENKPVRKFRTLDCVKILSRACVALTDHFVMSDYDNISGFNNKTKVVQLWHGVGFKAMGNGNTVKNTTVPGVVYSNDILAQEYDSFWEKVYKRCGYIRHAYFRELFEEYFMFVCPGQERIDMIGRMWNVKEGNFFMCGHPRNILLYSMNESTSEPKILYAPTYRFNYRKEKQLVNQCIEAFEKIESVMKEVNGTFVVRLHPHTWRNYKPKILNELKNYESIVLDEEKDIYATLGQYNMVISDYSSIALDMAMINRPAIFYCPDFEWFKENEAGFNLDFEDSIPGPMTKSWDETLEQVKEYLKNPDKDTTLRAEKCKYFFNPSVNDENNSERIVQEIKRRLGI